MNGTILVLVNGEVLTSEDDSTIAAQRANAKLLAEGLLPITSSENKMVIMHGNKPQVGYVLFRSELASHVLHTIPLDVCGADTQGATGYMLSQALSNALIQNHVDRKVVCILTQTIIDKNGPGDELPGRSIGPWYDRDKAEQLRQMRGWEIIEDPGRGYRRCVPTYSVKEILEIEVIQNLVDQGYLVIAGGGGGIPIARDDPGDFVGVEAVVETEEMAYLMAEKLNAKIWLSVFETDHKIIRSGLSTGGYAHISLDRLHELLTHESIRSRSVQRLLKAAARFLESGGEQVLVTTIQKLPDALKNKSGLRIGTLQPSIELFQA